MNNGVLYAIGDLHLSFLVEKKMDVFGGVWEGYSEKIKESFSSLGQEDVVVLCGDTSWGMNLSETLLDFLFLEKFQCRKIVLKGNHDYWWETQAKMKRFFSENGVSADILHNNAYIYQNTAICGTRGWFYEEEKGSSLDEKVMLREIGRLRASLEAGRRLTDGELLVFLHYPPLYEGYRCDSLVDLMSEYGVKRCYYGHLHGHARAKAIVGPYKGIVYQLVSADHVNFAPQAVVI